MCLFLLGLRLLPLPSLLWLLGPPFVGFNLHFIAPTTALRRRNTPWSLGPIKRVFATLYSFAPNSSVAAALLWLKRS